MPVKPRTPAQQHKRNGPPPGTAYKFDAKAKQKVLAAIQQGATLRHAAAFAGVSEDTLKRHRDNDADFAAEIARVREEQAVLYLSAIDKAAIGGDWRAAAYKLRVMFGAEYSDKVIVAGDPENPIHHVDDTDAAARAIVESPELSAKFADLLADVDANRRRQREVGPAAAPADGEGRGRRRSRSSD